jgi:hypothetical protein
MLCIKALKPYTLAGFKPGIFCSGGGRDDHAAMASRVLLSVGVTDFYGGNERTGVKPDGQKLFFVTVQQSGLLGRGSRLTVDQCDQTFTAKKFRPILSKKSPNFVQKIAQFCLKFAQFCLKSPKSVPSQKGFYKTKIIIKNI